MTRLTGAETRLFKAYDIRGGAPDPLSPELMRRIGGAFAAFLGDAARVAVGRDMRTSGPALHAALVEGLVEAGAEARDFGAVPTDVLAFAVRVGGLDGGAMVTASHNPPGDNGVKLVGREASPICSGHGLEEVRGLVEETPPGRTGARTRGRAVACDILDEYADFIRSHADLEALPPLRVVLDAGNGMAGFAARRIFAGLPGEFVHQFFEPDGSFPNRGANPLAPENRAPLAARVRSEDADLGVLWDGDADRAAFVDGNGDFLPGDFATALLLGPELAREPGAAIVYDERSSRAVPAAIADAGGRACPERTGHAFLKTRMRRERALFGGELSGHFYFRAAGYGDNGMLPVLSMLALIGARDRPLAEIAAPLRSRYFGIDEVSIPTADPAAALALVEGRVGKEHPGGEVSRLDGLAVGFSDWRFTLRPSNTEPVLRLTLEADGPEAAERHRDRILGMLAPLREPDLGETAPATAGDDA